MITIVASLTFKDLALTYFGVSNVKEAVQEVKDTMDVKKAQEIIAEKEKEEKLRKIEEQRLRNIKTKNIIHNKLKEIQKISLIEGDITWENTIEKQGWIKILNNNLNISIPMTYYIMYDVKNIEVLYVENQTAIFKTNLAKQSFEVIVTLDTENIKQNTDKWYGVDFDTHDFQNIIKIAQQDIKQYIENDENVYLRSQESLKIFIGNIVERLDLEVDYIE